MGPYVKGDSNFYAFFVYDKRHPDPRSAEFKVIGMWRIPETVLINDGFVAESMTDRSKLRITMSLPNDANTLWKPGVEIQN